jgi:molybdenum cofactor biosynthesis enzyme MoaA
VGVIEDLRKVLQDFLAPELRALNVRLDAIDHRFQALEKVSEARHGEVMTRIESVLAQIESLKVSFALDKRVERLESAKRDVRTT